MPQSIVKWLDYSKLKKQCEQMHQEAKKALESRKVTEGNRTESTRVRRSVKSKSGFMVMPGTLWCGSGDQANKYPELGLLSGTDKCCRRHDYCTQSIPGFSQRYGFTNMRPFTVSACWCDRSFRTCLKRVGTSDANLVGKLFFNVVQTKCFVFKAKKTCVQRSWWGKCQKKKRLKQAILRDNMPY